MQSSTEPRATHVLRIALFCLMCSTVIFAQSTGGRILGRVADPSGAVLAGVKVSLINDATATGRDVQTNENGDYVFVEVPPGNYHAEFEASGFKKNVRRGIILDVNQVITLNMTLQLGEIGRAHV